MPKCYCAPSKEDLEADSVLKLAGVTLEASERDEKSNVVGAYDGGSAETDRLRSLLTMTTDILEHVENHSPF
jgi:hypothetical protein